jgi:hypothetical protein
MKIRIRLPEDETYIGFTFPKYKIEEPVNVSNSNNTYNVISTNNLELPNEEIKVFVNGTLNKTAEYITLSNENINLK